MPPSLYLATLAQSLATNGSETEVYLSTIKTLTGETITTSQFSTLGRGVLTVDPLSSANVELIAFTAVDSSGIGVTGITRGLSALSNSTVTANSKYHPAGTQVIISFGVHNLLDLQTYITGLVSGSLGTASDTTAGSLKVSYNMGSLPRAKIALVSQSGSGATNLLVNPFSFEYLSGLYGNLPTTANPPVFSTVSTGAFSAPVSNPRIDLVVWATSGGVPGAVAIRQGTEGASPATPTPTEGDIVLCTVFNRVGQTKVLERNDSTNGYVLQWYEPTVYISSTPVYTKDATFGADQSQATSNSTYAVGEANATTKHSIIAQSFVPTVTSIQGAKLWKIADTGSFTGTVKVSLQASGLSGVSPSGTDLASYTISNAAWLKLNAAAEFGVAFSTEYTTLTVGATYWIVVTPSTSDNSNHPNLGANTAGGYASGALKYNNSTDGWVLTSTTILYFKSTCGILNKVVKTDSSGLIPSPAIRSYSLLGLTTTGVSASGTSETVVASQQVEGGTFGANSGLRVNIGYNFTDGTTPATLTVKVKFNGTQLSTWTEGSQSATTSKTETAMIYILNQNSVSSQKYLAYLIGLTNVVATAVGLKTYIDTPTGTSAVDISGVGLIEITFTLSSSANSAAAALVWATFEKIG